jgi:predicted nuclease of predicted toxin-antitoxin system
MKFLLNENISPKTAKFLRLQGFNVKSLIEEKIRRLTDEEVVKLAIKEKRTIITFDKDYSETYYFLFNKKVSIIVLNLVNQTVENVNSILKLFLEAHKLTPKSKKFKNKLIILSEKEEIIVK